MSLFAAIAEIENKRLLAALCTVVNVSGSTPRKPGAKMIVVDNSDGHGSILGTIGGGAIEHHVRECAIAVIRKRRAALITTSLRNELGMCCGGEMTVFIEPLITKPPFICFGAGHIAQALCPLASALGFLVHVVDERNELLALPVFQTAERRFDDASIFSIKEMPFFDDTFVVVATHDHDLDQRIIEGVLQQPFRYVALVGSQRKAEVTKKRLRSKSFADDDIARIHCPAGSGINAATPEEIAVSIAAHMVQVKNGSELRRVDRSRGLEHAHGQP